MAMQATLVASNTCDQGCQKQRDSCCKVLAVAHNLFNLCKFEQASRPQAMIHLEISCLQHSWSLYVFRSHYSHTSNNALDFGLVQEE